MAETSLGIDHIAPDALPKQEGEAAYVVHQAINMVLLAVSLEEWLDLIVRGGGPSKHEVAILPGVVSGEPTEVHKLV